VEKMTLEQREEEHEQDLAEGFELITLSRADIDSEIAEALDLISETDETEAAPFYKAAFKHAKDLAEVKKVKGVLVRVMDEGSMFGARINLLTAYDTLTPDEPETVEALTRVHTANRDFGRAIEGFGFSSGSSSVQCGDDFDGYIERRLKLEENERKGMESESSGNGFVDMLREMDSGYSTVLALKFE